MTGPSLVTVDHLAREVLVNGQKIDCPTSVPIVTGAGFGQPGEVTITLYPDALTVHGEATATTAVGDEETVDLGAAAVAREKVRNAARRTDDTSAVCAEAAERLNKARRTERSYRYQDTTGPVTEARIREIIRDELAANSTRVGSELRQILIESLTGQGDATLSESGLDLADEAQEPIQQDGIANLRRGSAHSDALQLLCSNGLLRQSNETQVHSHSPYVARAVTRVAAAFSLPSQLLQRKAGRRQALPPRPGSVGGHPQTRTCRHVMCRLIYGGHRCLDPLGLAIDFADGHTSHPE